MRGPIIVQRRIATLERLLEIPAADLKDALCRASDLMASALRADKVDAFLYDPSRDTLVAVGTSAQPLSELEKKLGLDTLPLSNGGRAVHVFQTGQTFVSGHVDQDPDELRGIKEALGIRSTLGVPFEIGGVRRGMLMITSQQPDHFSPDDVTLAEGVARWVAIVAHNAELVEQLAKNATEQGRRAVAEELITVLAHDLRNHLSPIDLRLNLIRRRAEREQRADDIRDLDLALRAIQRLVGLITDILDVARIDEGVFRMNIEPVAVLDLLEEIAKTLSTPEQPIHVRPSDDPIAAADPARLRQCLENLLWNALKHSPKRAPVTVLVDIERRTEQYVVLVEIIDEGPGISPDVLPHLFERFATGHPREGGLGLGLYLSKQIALMHGGDLSAESPPGKGARFSLRIPCYEDPCSR